MGIINASPFASGLLTDRGAAVWHPASKQDQALFSAAAEFCARQGTPIAKLALQFSSQNEDIPTTLFSSADPESVRRNVAWHDQPCDRELVIQVQQILAPVRDKEWKY